MTADAIAALAAHIEAFGLEQLRANQYGLIETRMDRTYFAQTATPDLAKAIAELWNGAPELLRLAQVGARAEAIEQA